MSKDMVNTYLRIGFIVIVYLVHTRFKNMIQVGGGAVTTMLVPSIKLVSISNYHNSLICCTYINISSKSGLRGRLDEKLLLMLNKSEDT